MSNEHVKYLLIGGGLASGSAAAAIRARDAEGSMMLVGQEVNRPYHRPPLSKEYLRGQKERSALTTHPVGWFTEQHIQLRTGLRAANLDTERRSATLENGEEVSFDKLLIATGGSAKHLAIEGADLPNVFYLRTIEDCDRLRHAADQAKQQGHRHARGRGKAAVIGGGLLGVELAASLTRMGLAVELLLGEAWPWNQFAGQSTGQFLMRYLEKEGIAVRPNHRPTRLEGDGRVQRIIVGDGNSIDCDLAVAAVGMAVNKKLLRGTPIAAENAILVDAHCQTSVPDIYAAGDCAAVFDPLFDKHRIIDHWDNARVTGEVAGANMAGENVPYRAVNYFFSDLFSLALSGWGEGRLVRRRLLRGSTNVEAPDFVEIGVDEGGRVAQVLAVGHVGEDALLADLVRRRVKVDGNEEAIKDPHWRLGDWV